MSELKLPRMSERKPCASTLQIGAITFRCTLGEGHDDFYHEHSVTWTDQPRPPLRTGAVYLSGAGNRITR